MKSPLPAKHSPRSDWLRLPLPVNGTRYLAAGLLVLVIFGVVLATYVSIERDLQSTLEERLSGMLRQQVAATIASAIMASSGRPYSIQQAIEILRDVHYALYPAPNAEPYNEWAKTREARLSKVHGPES